MLSKLKQMTTQPRLLLTVFFAFFVNGMMGTALGGILPYMKEEYSMNYALGGFILSSHQIGNLSAAFVAGFLPYFLGRKKSVVLMASGLFLGMLLFTLTGNPFLLICAAIFTGVSKGGTNTINNVVVTEITKDKSRSLNLLHAIFAAGALVSPALMVFFTSALHFSWRSISWLISALSIGVIFLYYTSSLSTEKASKSEKEQGNADFLRSRRFWISTGMLFSYLSIESTMLGWLVTYFKESGIMPGALAQTTSSVFWVMMLIGRLICASFMGKVQDKRRLLVGMSLAISCFYLLMIATTNYRVIFPALMALGLSMAGLYPTTMACMGSQFTSSTAAIGTCVALASMGGALMPTLVGVIAEKMGITAGMGAISVALVALVLLSIWNVYAARADKKQAVK